MGEELFLRAMHAALCYASESRERRSTATGLRIHSCMWMESWWGAATSSSSWPSRGSLLLLWRALKSCFLTSAVSSDRDGVDYLC